MLGFLKIKAIVIIIGILLVIIGFSGYLLKNKCESGKLSTEVSNAIKEPLTMDLISIMNSIITKTSDFIQEKFCPLLQALNKLLPFYWYLLIGLAITVIGFIIP